MNKKPFTVFFTQELPVKDGVTAYHLHYIEAESAEAAGDKCKRMLGGYSTILLVFEGHVRPAIEHKDIWTDEKMEKALERERVKRKK